MPYTHTRTHVHFFSEEQLAELTRVCDELAADAESRAPHVDAESRAAMMTRVAVLRGAIALCGEPVPE